MKHLKNFLYGILIGMSCLIPGFSGGTMALILGIYEELMESLSLITKKFSLAFVRLWSLAIGMVIGAVLAVFTIVKCLNNWPLITSGFFVGLVIASLPLTIKNARKEKAKLSSWVSLIICAIVSILLCFADKFGLILDLTKFNVLIIIYILIITSLSAAAMFIPAASGSLILLMFGIFEPIVTIIKMVLEGIIHGDFSIFVNYLYVIIPFFIGIIVGVIAVGRIITMLFKKHDNQLWYGILGLIIVSIFAIYYNSFHDPLHPSDLTRYENITNNLAFNIIGAIIMMVIGFLLIYFLEKLVNKKKQQLDNKEENLSEN